MFIIVDTTDTEISEKKFFFEEEEEQKGKITLITKATHVF